MSTHKKKQKQRIRIEEKDKNVRRKNFFFSFDLVRYISKDETQEHWIQ